jgi:hypothetical protein
VIRYTLETPAAGKVYGSTVGGTAWTRTAAGTDLATECTAVAVAINALNGASTNAILATGGATTTGSQNLSGTSLNGSVGTRAMNPPRAVSLVLSSHADWDATEAVVTGTDEDGRVVQETLLIPNGGNATVTGLRHFRTVSSIYIPAQSGTGGTATLGFGSSLGPIDHGVHGVAIYDASREPEAYPVDYVVPCLKKGRIVVNCETSYTDGNPVFVRFIASGDEVAGQVRATADANDCALMKRARFVGSGTAGVCTIDLQ